MNNKLIFSSFLIAVMLLPLTNSVFANGVPEPVYNPGVDEEFMESFSTLADENGLQNSSFNEMTISVPEYVQIVKDNTSVYTASAAPASGTSLTLSSPITAKFNVSTNGNNSVQLKLSASAPVGSNASSYSNITDNIIVFTKADGSATANAVTNITGGSPSADSNENAIAFPISCTTPDSTSEGGNIYNVSGSKEISCSISGSSIAGTFAMNDSSGNYTATLHITQLY